MLKHRIITASILAPLFIWGLLALPDNYLSLLFAIVIGAGAWEWSRLMGITSLGKRIVYVITVLLVLSVTAWNLGDRSWTINTLVITSLFWCWALYQIIRYERSAEHRQTSKAVWINAIIGIVLLVPTWLGLMTLLTGYEQGRLVVLFLFVLIWSADIGAYFSGRQWGKRKLAPNVSPGKSWEGVIGGIILASLMSIAMAVYLNDGIVTIISFLLLSIFTASISVAGDLFESIQKRQAGVKDSGNLLPGHGGILDRIDSLTIAAPVFTLGLLLMDMTL